MKLKKRTRISLMHEFGEDSGCCSKCGTKTVLGTLDMEWRIDSEEGCTEDFISAGDEVSGHICPKCKVVTAIYFHQHQWEVK